MTDQSHKEEMRAALVGDFERRRTRLEGGEEESPEHLVQEPEAHEEPAEESESIAWDEPTVTPEPSRSRFARLIGRRSG